jgi:hypothetical protein
MSFMNDDSLQEKCYQGFKFCQADYWLIKVPNSYLYSNLLKQFNNNHPPNNQKLDFTL